MQSDDFCSIIEENINDEIKDLFKFAENDANEEMAKASMRLKKIEDVLVNPLFVLRYEGKDYPFEGWGEVSRLTDVLEKMWGGKPVVIRNAETHEELTTIHLSKDDTEETIRDHIKKMGDREKEMIASIQKHPLKFFRITEARELLEVMKNYKIVCD